MPNNNEPSERLSRYVVGIDLGTTNCTLAYVDTEPESVGQNRSWIVEHLKIPQWVDFSVREARDGLPSFQYQLTPDECSQHAMTLPWESSEQADATATSGKKPFCVGVLARDAGRRNPGRRIQSAKSWLSHSGVDRSTAMLPWHGDAEATRYSPVDVSAMYLSHLKEAWDHAFGESHRLCDQDVVITLPASFDEMARKLTIEAAKKAGLKRVQLIEEPQAVFYDWIDRQGDDWSETVQAGDLILVCDIGGGTTDLTLIRVKPARSMAQRVDVGSEEDARSNESDGTVQFHRVAVGQHLILGGDNLDLAIATLVESKLRSEQKIGESGLGSKQWDHLTAIAREVKEVMLGEGRPEEYTISLPGRGSSLVGGAMQTKVTKQDVDSAIVDGFFPLVDLAETPVVGSSGFQEFGLPYAADPAVTKHLAHFLTQHRHRGVDAEDQSARQYPNRVLFNGGVMAADTLRQRILDSLRNWFPELTDPQAEVSSTEQQNVVEQDGLVLAADRLDLAVARGAAYYGMVRRGDGVKIAANLGRTYYLQVQQDPPLGMALIPGSAETGQVFRTDDHPLMLRVGAPVQFPLWVSSTRLADKPGELIAIDEEEMTPLPALRTALVGQRSKEEKAVGVALESVLGEIGTVQIHCVELESKQRWKLDFDIRSTLETDREAHAGTGEAAGILDEETAEAGCSLIRQVFDASKPADGGLSSKAPSSSIHPSNPKHPIKPGQLVKRLQSVNGTNRRHWPPTMLRHYWQCLMDHEAGRRQSESHESRWLNLLGYCLRPGYGVAVDDWRVNEVWRRVHGKIAFGSASTQTEAMILWRRIAGGLHGAQQEQLAAPWKGMMLGRSMRLSDHECMEVWRLLASLERLSVIDKTRLGQLALEMLGKPKHRKLHGVLLWALGRLGSRQPGRGAVGAVVSSSEVSIWAQAILDRFAGRKQAELENTHWEEARLALVQMARFTEDRFRDLPTEVREKVARLLQATDTKPHFVEMVLEGGRFDHEEASAIFGEALPLGIQLNQF